MNHSFQCPRPIIDLIHERYPNNLSNGNDSPGLVNFVAGTPCTCSCGYRYCHNTVIQLSSWEEDFSILRLLSTFETSNDKQKSTWEVR